MFMLVANTVCAYYVASLDSWLAIGWCGCQDGDVLVSALVVLL